MERAGLGGKASAFYLELSRNVVELLVLAGKKKGDLGVRLTSKTRAAMARARGGEGGKRPVVIAASHTGNWEAAAFALARLEPVAVVAKRQGVSSVERFIHATRARFGVTVLLPRGAMANAADALAKGTIVAMPIDQAPDRAEHGDVVDFLGADALVDRAPFVLAKRARATVLVAVCEGSRVHVIDVLEAADLVCPRAAARRATRALEAHVRAFPTSWLWLHRRWKRVASRRLDVKKCSEFRQVA